MQLCTLWFNSHLTIAFPVQCTPIKFQGRPALRPDPSPSRMRINREGLGTKLHRIVMNRHTTIARCAANNWGERERWEFNAPPVCLYISYVRHFWSRGPRATRKRKPAHLKFKGHMHACCIILYVANASRAITTLIERLHMYSSSLITSSAG